MNKTWRLALLTVLALTLTCLCLARPILPLRPGFPKKIARSGCVPRCASRCRKLGMLTYQTCKVCYCYTPTPVVGVGGCEGGGCGGWGCYGGGCYGGGCYGGDDGGGYGGCGGGGGCGGYGGGCDGGGGGCGGGGCGC